MEGKKQEKSWNRGENTLLTKDERSPEVPPERPSLAQGKSGPQTTRSREWGRDSGHTKKHTKRTMNAGGEKEKREV